MRSKYNHYTEEFKVQCILEYEGGKSISAIAREHDLPRTSVKNWCYRSKDNILGLYYADMRRRDGHSITTDVEIIPEELMPRKVGAEDLKKENKALREENEYLKDKVAYLEALYEVIRQDPASVVKKNRNREGPGVGQEERQEAVRHRRRVTEVLLPEPQAEEERRRGCGPA